MDVIIQIFFGGGLVAVVLYIMKLIHDKKEMDRKLRGLDYELRTKEADINSDRLTTSERLERFNTRTDKKL